MNSDVSWFKQRPGEPLFPEVLWSRPENRRLAGKLFIVGGNLHKFTAVSEAYSDAMKAGAGVMRLLLPDALSKTLGKVLPEASYAASTISGGFARKSLAGMIDGAEWGDATLLAGDLGRSSETAIAVENFVQKYDGALTLSGDSLEIFTKNPLSLLTRQNLLMVGELPLIQKLLARKILIKQTDNLHQLVGNLNDFTSLGPHILTYHSGQIIVSSRGRTSTTSAKFEINKLAAKATVFWLQNPDKPFEAITTATIS